MILAKILKSTSASVRENEEFLGLRLLHRYVRFDFTAVIFIIIYKYFYFLDSLENDISNLYQELSENAAASVGVRNDEDLDDVTEASDCVTVEFLDQQISGNTGNSEKITRRRLTDSPEF